MDCNRGRAGSIVLWVCLLAISSSCMNNTSDMEVLDKRWILEEIGVNEVRRVPFDSAERPDIVQRMEWVFRGSRIDTLYFDEESGRLVAFDLALDASIPGVAEVVYSPQDVVSRIDFYGLFDNDLKKRVLPTNSFKFYHGDSADFVYEDFEGLLYTSDTSSVFRSLTAGVRGQTGSPE